MDNTTHYKLKKPAATDFYNIQDHNDNMNIIDTELDKLERTKAPTGHGLGAYAFSTADATLLDALKRGCGFYQIQNATDTPSTSPAWINLFQSLRGVDGEGRATGFQVAAFDYWKNDPKIWFRTIISHDTSAWNEFIHTGNITKYADAKFACGTYSGALSGLGDSSNGITNNPYYRSKTLPLPFKADYIDIICVNDYTWRINIARNVEKAVLMWQDHSVNQKTSVKWSGNSVTWGNNIANNDTGNLAVMNYSGYTYAWFAYGKGEGV